MWPDQLPQHQNMVNVYQVFNSDVNQENAPISITADNAVEKIIAYFSTLYRLKRSVAWLFRFRHCLKGKAARNHDTSFTIGPLTTKELRKAEIVLAKYLQAKEYPKWIKYLSGKTSRIVNKSSSL